MTKSENRGRKKQEQEFFPIPAQLRFCKNLDIKNKTPADILQDPQS